MNKLNLSILAFATVFFTSCYYDNFRELHPIVAATSNCDSTGVISYSTQIVPIITKNCTNNCHTAGAAGGGSRDLSIYANVNSAATNGAVPGDGGSLYGTITWDPTYGNDMPKNASKLSDCDITKIKKWAAAGGLNN